MLFIGSTIFNSGACVAASDKDQDQASQPVESVEHMMAGLSDEQVRQLLIDELKKTAESEELFSSQQMKGPAFTLSRMLRKLSRGQDDNRNQIETLFSFIPKMGPDLYKVFIKL